MRLHRTTSEAVIQALEAIFDGKRYADKVIEKVLKQNPKWDAHDLQHSAIRERKAGAVISRKPEGSVRTDRRETVVAFGRVRWILFGIDKERKVISGFRGSDFELPATPG
jgi:hypothetical protein